MSISEYLAQKPVLLIFIAICLGFSLSRIKLGVFTTATAGMLVSGFLLGAAGMTLPVVVKNLGLLIFIYSIGISAGPKMFTLFTRRNIKYLWAAGAIFIFTTVIPFVFCKIMGLSKSYFIGIYCGIFGNASALANLLVTNQSPASTVAFCMAYLISLFLVLGFVGLIMKRYKLDLNPALDGNFSTDKQARKEMIVKEAVLIKNTDEKKCADVSCIEDQYSVIITDIIRKNQSTLPESGTSLQAGDIALTEGYKSDIKHFERSFGEKKETPHVKHPGASTRQILVTNRELEGMTIGEIQVRKKYHVVITRIWRSGIFIAAPDSNTALEVGDSLVVYGTEKNLDNFQAFVGYRDKSVGEVDFLSMSIVIIPVSYTHLTLPTIYSV